MRNVLVVDDAKSIRELLAKSLELSGFAVDTASDGRTALEMVIKGQYELAFLDIKLPIVSGTDVLRRMREKGIRIPVVVITAFGNIKNAVDCTRLGAVAYIQKPFTVNRINTVLDELNIHAGGVAARLGDEIGELMKKDRFQEVQNILKNQLASNPLDAEIYHLLSETSEKLGKGDEAEKYRRLYETLRAQS